MLNRNQADLLLKQWWKSDAANDDDDFDVEGATALRLRKLPPKLRKAGLGILDRKPDNDQIELEELSGAERAALMIRGTLALDNFSRIDRARVFDAFVPGWADSMERTWHLLTSGPFSHQSIRRPFRTPLHPEYSAFRRGEWLTDFARALGKFDTKKIDPLWLAAWAPHIHIYGVDNAIGYFLAAQIDQGDENAEEIFRILKDSASNQHQIGQMGQHVFRALLNSSRPDAWAFMENLLLAAQRQEGLRQSILETVHESHPEAFLRMAKLILAENLIRFSSVVRAIDVWFGLEWDSVSTGVVKNTLENAVRFLEDPVARQAALTGKNAEQAYLALWAAAFEDANSAVEIAKPILSGKDLEKRFAAASLLNGTNFPEAAEALYPVMRDPDLRVAIAALSGVRACYGADDIPSHVRFPDLFDQMEELLHRYPENSATLKPLIWPWITVSAKKCDLAFDMLEELGDRPVSRILPLLEHLNLWGRVDAVKMLSARKQLDTETRQVLLKFCTDGSPYIREHAVAAITKTSLHPGEALVIEKALTRKPADVRRAAIVLLLTQNDSSTIESARRLTESSDRLQRIGGLEILRAMTKVKRSPEACRSLAVEFKSKRKSLNQEERSHVDAIEEQDEFQPGLDNGFGLLDSKRLTPRLPPKRHRVALMTPTAASCLKSLDDHIKQNRHLPLKGSSERHLNDDRILGECNWWFSHIDYSMTRDEIARSFPLGELWNTWFEKRPKSLKDKDGFELVRASLLLELQTSGLFERRSKTSIPPELRKLHQDVLGTANLPRLLFPNVIESVLEWLRIVHSVQDEIDFLLSAAETTFAMIPVEVLEKVRSPLSNADKAKDSYRIDAKPELWDDFRFLMMWSNGALDHFKRTPNLWSEKQKVDFWKVLHWADQTRPGEFRYRPPFEFLLSACTAGAAAETDIYDHLIGPRHGPGEVDPRSGLNDIYSKGRFESLQAVTAYPVNGKLKQLFNKTPGLAAIIDRCRDRILEIELARGDLPTIATRAAISVQSYFGIQVLIRILTAIGDARLKNERSSWGERTQSRPVTFQHLLKHVYPLDHETPEDFKRAIAPLIKSGFLNDQRLVEIAFTSLQWLPHIEHALGWPGFSEGVYWYLAHMTSADTEGVLKDESEKADTEQDNRGNDDSDMNAQSAFERIVTKRTPLSQLERQAGAIDVAWFHRTYAQIGKKRWEILAAAGRCASSSQQAAKAELIGNVILGRASKTKLIADIRGKKLKNQVRLLGLFPLPDGPKRQPELLARYKVLQEYQQYAKGLGAMSKPAALQAVEIGLANLASTAGYPDPLRMMWALEAAGLEDLNQGSVSLIHEGVKITLTLDEDARPQLNCSKAGKLLKTIPPALKKSKKVAELLERHAVLKRQASRLKKSLEDMMCRGDRFTGQELVQLAAHPLIWPLLSKLILVGDGIMGYPDKKGRALRDYDGKLEPIRKQELLRIAHSHDLLISKKWPQWQRDCFQAERIQPIKQVFRELYVVTKQEISDGPNSSRYAGQQINPSQAFALLGHRGWRTNDEVEKTFYNSQITVSVNFGGGWGSPTDVEGLTLDTILFHKQNESKPLSLKNVPPVIFSEVMRDIDLVVSVAHRGGVDPEASASTVEMRATLLQETCNLFSLKNVRIKKSHVVIKGQLGEYSVHLGSGGVHRLPGGAVCIVAVGAQHRGRLFLPFADDDPRTAEVISKVLLLARDHEIQDPSILEQLSV